LNLVVFLENLFFSNSKGLYGGGIESEHSSKCTHDKVGKLPLANAFALL